MSTLHQVSEGLWSNAPPITGAASQPERVCMFDLDGTLIQHRRQPTGPDDFQWLPGVLERLHDLAGPVVILTNQGGLAHGNAKILPRLEHILAHLIGAGITALMYVFGGYDGWRKPSSRVVESHLLGRWSCARWMYVGDYAGRPGDEAGTDRKFAYNVHLLFRYLDGNPPTSAALDGYVRGSRMVFYTPEAYFQRQPMIALGWPGLDPGAILRRWTTHRRLTARTQLARLVRDLRAARSLVILIGPPGSGKTHLGSALSKDSAGLCVIRDAFKTLGAYQTQARQMFVRRTGSLILDATHPSRTSRMADRMAVDPEGTLPLVYVCMDMSLEEAHHWNNYRMLLGRGTLIPDVAYHAYRKQYVEPTLEEGAVRIVRIGLPPEFTGQEQKFRFLQWDGEL
jgi:bifunctional polynucleotide phosphatase/kinase